MAPSSDQFANHASNLAYPKRDQGRAVLSWNGTSIDLGVWGTMESLLTYIHVREHLAAGNDVPSMDEFRRQVMAEHRPAEISDEVATLTHLLEREREIVQRERDRANLAEDKLREATESVAELVDRKSTLATQNEALKNATNQLTRNSRRLIALSATVCVTVVLGSFLLLNLQERESRLVPSVDGVVINDHELALIRGDRTYQKMKEDPARTAKVITMLHNIEAMEGPPNDPFNPGIDF